MSRGGRALSLLVCLFALTSPARAQDLSTTRVTLSNGLDVVLNHDPRTPFAVVTVVYDVGHRDNPLQQSGLAHLTEHLMFRRTAHVEDTMFFDQLQRAGATHINGVTGVDATTYYEIVPTHAVGLALWHESERMGFLRAHLQPEIVAAERKTILNERAEKRGYGLQSSIMERLFPENHPYHAGSAEHDDDIARLRLEDVREFLTAYYVPNNAHLLVSGMFDPERTLSAIRTYFERIPRGRTVRRQGELHLSGVPARHVTHAVLRWNVPAPIASLAWRTPALFAPGDAELDLLAMILCNRLRIRNGLPFSCRQASYELASTFIISAQSETVPTNRLVEMMDLEIRVLSQHGAPSNEELAWAVSAQRTQRLFATETLAARSSLLMSYARVAGVPDFFRQDIGRYGRADAQAVQLAARTFLYREGRVQVVVQPTGDAHAPDAAPEEVDP